MTRKNFYYVLFFCVLISPVFGDEASIDPTEKSVKGLSSWVDTIKTWLGFPEVPKEKNTEKSDTSSTASLKNDPKKEAQSTLKTPLVQPTLSEKEKEKRLKEYQTFERQILQAEEDAIASVEEDTQTKIDFLMKDQRVVILTKKNPEITLEELPEDIYRTILDLSKRQEQTINKITEENDQKLKEKAQELEIAQEVSLADETDNDERRSNTLLDPKTKVTDIGNNDKNSEEKEHPKKV